MSIALGEAPVDTAIAVAIQRVLPTDLDPLSLYASLSDRGRRADTALFEARGGSTLLMHRAAVRAECRGESVILAALSANGERLLASVAARLPGHVSSREPGRLTLHFAPTVSEDSEERLLAPSPFDALRSLIAPVTREGEEPFAVTALGIIAFDYAALSENLPANPEDPLDFPDYLFWIPDSLVLFEPLAAPRVICTAFSADGEEVEKGHFDAVERLAELVRLCAAAVPLNTAALPLVEAPPVDVDLDDQAYRAIVGRLKEEIVRGEIYQVVPSRTFRARCSDPLRTFALLREHEKSPYGFFVAGSDFTLFGASPEASVRVFREGGDKIVEVRPIAGTRPRGGTIDEDGRFEADLRLDSKETAEHMMLVDLARNDVARISVPGTRHVARLMTVERHARVMHLVSSVIGKLAADRDAFHALAACLNVGTLSGAPKVRATELLRETERTKRGPYGGAIGWINHHGLMDSSVVIRSAIVRDGLAHVRAGAGVVYDSDPQAEADETHRKASVMLSILATAESAS